MSATPTQSNPFFRRVFNRVKNVIVPRPDPFLEMCARYERRLDRWPLRRRNTQSRGCVGVLVTPWLGTAVPLFSLEIARMLAAENYEVTLLCDCTDLVGNAGLASHHDRLEKILRHLAGAFKVIRAREMPEGETDVPTARAILFHNAIWHARGEDKAGEFFEKRPEALEKIAKHLGRIERFLQNAKFDWLLVPGGIFGLSGVYVAAAQKTGVPFSTYDSGAGVLRLSQDSIAAHLGDLPKTFATVQPRWRGDRAMHATILQAARAELSDRMEAKDFRQFQVAPAGHRDDLQYDLLVPLNIRWDSAALARQRLFSSVNEWLTALLEWVGANSSATICIRQHPRERLGFARGSDTFAPLQKKFAHLGRRFRFVEATEALNTYDLLRGARIVLPHTSTVGIEAAMLGKPVALATTCYYENFGFCEAPPSREAYFHLLEKARAGELYLSPEQIEDAALAYYLTQRCALLRTRFTPDPNDALKWMTQSPDELWASDELMDFRKALLNHEPLSLVRHRRFQNAD